MIDTTNPSASPSVNEDFLAQSQTVGGVINPEAYRATPIETPKFTPAKIAPMPVQNPDTPGAIPNSSKPVQGPINSTKDFANAAFNHMSNAGDYASDPYKYGKTWTYDADYTGIFYKRYADQSRVYDKLGFSPWKDNEALYNQESTWLDNFKRSLGSAATLTGLSFSGALPWNAWSGTSDLEDAKTQERAFAKGSDTRGGMGAWINNQVLNSGFSVGVMGEFAAEEAVTWAASTLAAPESFGASWLAAAAQTGSKVKQVSNILAKGMKVAELSKNIGKGLEYVKDLDWARDFYNGLATGKTLRKVGKAISPHTVDYLTEMNRLGKAGKDLNMLAKTSRGVGAFYKDVRAINAVLSESKQEAGSVELELRDKLIDNFYAKNGKMPSAQDYADIYATAKSGASATYWWNVPAIYISNKIVFEKMLTGFKPLSSTREELTQGFKNWALKEEGEGVYKAVKTGLRADIKGLFDKSTWKPATLTKNFVGRLAKYSTANITEGLQEQAQEAISGAMKEYYQDRYEHPALVGSRSVWSYLGQNASKQLTTSQGWDTFASGFFMGGLLQLPQHVVFTKGMEGIEYIKDREGYKKARVAEEERVNQTVNALNSASKFLGEYLNPTSQSASAALRQVDNMPRAAKNQDKKAFLDIKDEVLADHFYTLAQTDKLGLIRDQIKDYMKMKPEEMVEAWGKDGKTKAIAADRYNKKLGHLLELTDRISKRYEDITDMYTNPFNEWRYDPEKQSTEWITEKMNRVAFEEAKKVAVMADHHYDTVAGRIKDLLDKAGTARPVAEASASDFQVLYADKNLDQEIVNLQAEVETYGQSSSFNKQDVKTLKEKKERLRLLTEFQDERDSFLSTMEAYNEGLEKGDTEAVKQARAIMQVRKGAKVKYTSKGKEKQFVVDRISGQWAYDKEGKRYKSRNLEVLAKAKSQFSEDEFIEEAAVRLHDSYSNYVKHIADSHNTKAFDKNITESFKDYIDFLRLNEDKRSLANAVNWLNNPQALVEFASRRADMYKAEHDTYVQKMNKALKAYMRKMGINTLLNELYKIGVYMDEEGLAAFQKDHVISDFYDVAEGHAKIDPKSAKYKEAIDLIEDWEKKNNVTYLKEISNREQRADAGMFTGKMRSKINEDKRSYAEHAAYWGFSPTDAESFVNTKDILTKVVNSPYATFQEKSLARRLLRAVSADSRVRFNKEGRAGYFTYTEEAKKGITMDARFFSSDFKNEGSPIETVLLHEIIHELTSQELDKNPEFKSKISALLKRANQEFKDKPVMQDGKAIKPFYGLKNEYEFVAETMSNDVFRKWLAGIKYDTTGKSLWTEFVDSIKRIMQALLGTTDENLLDEAIYVITSKIDEFYGESKNAQTLSATTATGTTAAKKKLLPNASIDEFRAAGILPKLTDAFKDFVEFQKTGGSAEWMNIDLTGLSIDEIASRPDFKQFMLQGVSSVNKILNDYNGGVAPAVPAQPTVQTTATPTVQITPYPSQKLINKGMRFGFTKEEIVNMNPEDREEIANATSKGDVQGLIDRVNLARQAVIQNQAQKRASVIRDLEDKIDNAEYVSELQGIESEIAIASVEDPLGIDVDALVSRIQQRMIDMAKPTYENIEVGDVVTMMNNSNMKIIEKENGVVKLRNLRNNGHIKVVEAANIQNEIKYRFEPGLEGVDLTPPISPENQQASNESLQNAMSETSDEQINRVATEVANKTEEELENDLDNDSGCGS